MPTSRGANRWCGQRTCLADCIGICARYCRRDGNGVLREKHERFGGQTGERGGYEGEKREEI